MKTLILASDHAAFEAKEQLKPFLHGLNLKVIDCGTHNGERCDYPDYVQKGIEALRSHDNAIGVFLCGSGIGVSMAANRYQGIRAARCLSVEDAQMTKAHNNANVLCLAARVSSLELMQNMIQGWLDTDFEGGRHIQRIKKFDQLGS